MSALPAAIISGSYQSASNVIDAVESYRRTQTQHSDFLAGSSSPSDPPGLLPDLEVAPSEDGQSISPPEVRERLRSDQEWLIHDQWDEDLPTPIRTPTLHEGDDGVATPCPHFGERTPLLVRSSPSRISLGRPIPIPGQQEERAPQHSSGQRRISASSVRSRASFKAKYHHEGQSTFAQTLLNAGAVLFGIGMLSEPLAFAYAGWIGGTILIIWYGLISCYTAKILARIVLDDPSIRSYADIGRKAFGPRSIPIINTIFGLELFTVTVALVTLYADSLYAVVPRYSSDTYKVLGLIVLIPAVLLPLSLLSYASITGIFSLTAVIGIILFDGFTKPDSPGSIWSPADTSLGIDNYKQLGIAFGLFMAGFAGHAAVPTLARDMIDPSRFDEMINWAFVVATGIYTLLGIVGYLMFGNAVSDEFSQDLIRYNTHPALNTIALWGLVITPLTKYALSARPLSITLEVLLGIESTGASSPDNAAAPASSSSHTTPSSSRSLETVKVKRLFVAIERIVLTVLSVMVSILVPEFASVMAVLGATFSFILCIIGPLSAKIALTGGFRKCGLWDGLLLLVSAGMAIWGTLCVMESAAPVP